MNIVVDKSSGTPLYKQIISFVQDGIRDGSIVSGETLPSLNELAARCGISMETAKKAYVILKKAHLISGHQGKGYTVDVRAENAPLRILLLLDKLSAYKLAIHRGLTDALSRPADVTIHVYNQDIGFFEKMAAEALGTFDHYIVATHFGPEVKTDTVAKVLGRFPNDRLILIDHDIPEVKGKVGRVYQDYANDAATALASGMERIRKYSNVVIVHSKKSLYCSTITPAICGMLADEGIIWKVTKGFQTESMMPGTLFIVLGGQLDTEHFSILREAADRGYALGKDVGIITFNDEPVNEFICGGLASLSSDFYAMGRIAANMINEGSMQKVHNPFSLIPRNSI